MKRLEQDLGEADTPLSHSELSLLLHKKGSSSALSLHPALAAQQGYWSRGAFYALLSTHSEKGTPLHSYKTTQQLKTKQKTHFTYLKPLLPCTGVCQHSLHLNTVPAIFFHCSAPWGSAVPR